MTVIMHSEKARMALLTEEERAAFAKRREDSLDFRDKVTEWFHEIDTDSSGMISGEEFSNAMVAHGTMTQTQALKLFASVDEDRSGTLDSAEFMSLVMHHEVARRAMGTPEELASIDHLLSEEEETPTFRGMIHPQGPFRATWDMTTILLLIYVLMLEVRREGGEVNY